MRLPRNTACLLITLPGEGLWVLLKGMREIQIPQGRFPLSVSVPTLDIDKEQEPLLTVLIAQVQ